MCATGIPDLDDVPSATYWPSIRPDKATSEWNELRDWVERLQLRFPHLDHHVIPPCWWLHNEHVEALAAPRDHERVSYIPAAPATAPVEWMRALRDIKALLRSWMAEWLFISHRTAGYHLGKVFAKLDVAGRAQLRSALDSARS